jgi:hypothetical protein
VNQPILAGPAGMLLSAAQAGYAAKKAFALNFFRRCDISDNQVSRFSAKGNRVDDSTPHPSG